MSVDTNVKGKNLAPYRKLRHDQFQILITPQLIGMAESMRWSRRVDLEEADGRIPSCAGDR